MKAAVDASILTFKRLGYRKSIREQQRGNKSELHHNTTTSKVLAEPPNQRCEIDKQHHVSLLQLFPPLRRWCSAREEEMGCTRNEGNR
eukprot:CAMPEP_0198110004 /NCGR_PEP_ID=MMETSP1442-20131203/2036_1 /TAXON_ID= /ORGANISM="Craspedostauros australis, Strain CCMP3328" /LENGTH=87 /DNA_ID=CAMNT_0043765883 /DNA_START=80 /DNA_END=343 /DNA_ORIENTATION=+